MEEQVKIKEKRGYIFSLDALIALIVIVALLLAISPSFYTKQRDITLHHDILNVLLSVKVGESDNNYVKNTLIQGGYITDPSKSLLEQMALFYAMGDNAHAEEMAKSLLNDISPSENVAILFDDERIASTTGSDFPSDAKNIWVARQVIGGIQKGNVTGFSARAFLTRAAQAKYFYFGGYIGQGNISANIEINGTVINANMEIAASDNFTLYVNNNLVKSYTVAPSPFVPNRFEIPITATHWENGNNTLKFVSQNETNFYIAGGYIKVLYTDSEYVPKKRHYIPGIEGIINLYDSFYIPGVLNSMNIYLHFNSSNVNGSNVVLNVGNVTVYNKSSEGRTDEITLTDSNLKMQAPSDIGKVNYSELSNKTIPIRLWTPGINFTEVTGIGNADVILITDVSGSMDRKLDEDKAGDRRTDCENMNNFPLSTQKLSLAKCLDKNFTRIVLSTPGNRVGLASFSADYGPYYPLSTDIADLENHINTYTPSGTTCICCGINKAYELLSTIIEFGDDGWKYNKTTNCGSYCNPSTISGNCNITNWYKPFPTFDDSSWSSIDLPYASASGSEIVEENNVTYFRKHFTLTSQVLGDGILRTRNRRGVECYLNGNFIGLDTACTRQNTKTWNNEWTVQQSYFVQGDNVLACRIRTGSFYSSSYFDAQLIAHAIDPTRKKFIIVMSDGEANRRCTTLDNCPPEDTTCSTPSCYAGKGLFGESAGGCATTCSSDEGLYTSSAPMMNTIWSAKRAYDNLNANVSAVGFALKYCPPAVKTLNETAKAGTGIFRKGDNVTDLIQIYQEFAQNIVSISYISQIAYITGNISMKLFPDSFIEFDYPTPAIPKGMVITAETPPFGNNETTGNFLVPSDAEILEANIVSYSSENWTHRLSVNSSATAWQWTNVFKLEDYGQDYRALGDPYVVNIPIQYLAKGKNYINISASDKYDKVGRGADADKAIYTILREIIGYSKIAGNSSGCIWTITFYDDSKIEIKVPSDYQGTRTCALPSQLDEDNNVLDSAIYNLLSKLDLDGDYKIDTIFGTNEIQLNTTILSGIPYTHVSEVKIVVWR